MTISVHRPKVDNSQSISNFPWFLAGVIDGDGHFNKIPQLCIVFHEKDVKVAYYLKRLIAYGTVSKVKHKRAVTFLISHKAGLEKICHWVRDKLHLESKQTQYNTRLHLLPNFLPTGCPRVKFLDSSWFSGFFFSDGSFQIKLIKGKKTNLPELRLPIEIDQKDVRVLRLIKETFGGSIGFRAKQNTYYWSSVSFRSAEKVIAYFDKYPLMGAKLLEYIVWRRCYVKCQQKFHLQPLGILWMEKQKHKLSVLKR